MTTKIKFEAAHLSALLILNFIKTAVINNSLKGLGETAWRIYKKHFFSKAKKQQDVGEGAHNFIMNWEAH